MAGGVVDKEGKNITEYIYIGRRDLHSFICSQIDHSALSVNSTTNGDLFMMTINQ